MTQERRYGPYSVSLSHPDKPLFDEDGPTKADLADHYAAVADAMLRQIGGRPLTLQRAPGGLDGDVFYQKARPNGLPDWVDDARVERREGRAVRQVVARRAGDLVALAQLAAVALHAPPARAGDLERPDRLVVDLDPPGDTGDAAELERLRDAARAVREGLESEGLTAFLQTTGSRGFHVVAPLRPDGSFDVVRGRAQRWAEGLVQAHPELLSTEQRKDRREGRIYLDLLRNAYGQTFVAPYSPRARPGGPVATPLDWDELDDTAPQDWTVGAVARRLSERSCPWKHLARHAAAWGG